LTGATVIAAEPYVPAVWRVAATRRETPDTITLKLAPPSEIAKFRFEAGQFNMLYVFGCGESAISISGDPGTEDSLTHTVRAVGGVTRPMADLKEGDGVGVRGPFGRPWPLDAARGKNLLFIAGGLGLAPLRPAILDALRSRTNYKRLTILYGARDPRRLLFRRDITNWRGRLDTELGVTVDHADPDWRGDVGVILRLIKATEIETANTVAFVCGPEIMMRFSADTLLQRGLAAESVHVSLERNMKCAIARCGHCQFGQHFLCTDGPVFRYDRVRPLLGVPEI